MTTPAAYRAVIGDPTQPADLPQALADAYAGGARHITIRPGTYTIPRTGHHVFFPKAGRT